jgi:hypothetical protein
MSDTPILLDSIHISLRDLYRQEKLAEDLYFKGLVGLALRWMLLSRREDALSLVGELPPSYVAISMPFQMACDETFHKVSHGLAEMLAEGLPDLTDEDVRIALMLIKKPVAQA